MPASLIAVVVNKNNPISSITTEQLNTIWAPEADGQVTNWSQVDPSWENAEMTLYGPGADSGTFDYFTKKINVESGASRADYTPSEDDNVLVQGVVGDEGAMGYFGLSYYFENQDQLKALAIDSGNGPVAPSPETVIDGTYTPLSRPIFIYVNIASLERPEVAEFVQFYLENAEELVPETGSVPLPATGSGLSYQSSMAVLKSSL